MKALLAFAVILTLPAAVVGNIVTQSPLTMEQLMDELRIQGGNFIFEFESPVYGRVAVTTTEYPNGPKKVVFFDTATANKHIELFFSVSALFVGNYSKGDSRSNPQKMLIKLSDCKATEGTHVIHYEDKFSENRFSGGGINRWKPAIPEHPQLDKEYILHNYFRSGDPYEVKATIQFSPIPFKIQG